MSVKTKIATLAIAALAITGSIAASTQSAHAGPKGKAIAAGLVGAAIVGTTIAAASQPHYGYTSTSSAISTATSVSVRYTTNR
jgi:hypothetical protein